jgi:hypothetical protein
MNPLFKHRVVPSALDYERLRPQDIDEILNEELDEDGI